MKIVRNETTRIFLDLVAARTRAYGAICEQVIRLLPDDVRRDQKNEGFREHDVFISPADSLSRLFDQSVHKCLALAEHLATSDAKDIGKHFARVAATLIERAGSPTYATFRSQAICADLAAHPRH